MLVSKDNFLFASLEQRALRRNAGAKCATKRIKHTERDAASWLAAGRKLRKPSLCIYHNSFRAISICRIQRDVWRGEKEEKMKKPYQTKKRGKKRMQDEKNKDFQGELVAGFLKGCSNYTVFHVFRQNLHVKLCNL